MSVIDFLSELLQFLTAATACTRAVLAARRRRHNRDSPVDKRDSSVDKEDGGPSPDPSEEEAQKSSSEERDRAPSSEEGNRKTSPEEV
ncbi:hypothetical protein [Nonomuraea sp. NPDC049028]|uniref:hypothetical protein n=1 Tax=Nonomuraea sp. NPDC049028 TaxID=3364348 RepID=UPI003718E364